MKAKMKSFAVNTQSLLWSWEESPRFQIKEIRLQWFGPERVQNFSWIYASVAQRDNVSTHLPSTFTDKVILAPFFTFLLVNLSRNLGGISCSRESENHIIDGTWWHLLCEFRLLKNSWGVCYHLLWLLLPISDGSSFSSGSVTQREQTKWQNYVSAHELKKKKLF